MAAAFRNLRSNRSSEHVVDTTVSEVVARVAIRAVERGNGDGSGGRDHGQGGWFGDREDHSEASRRVWDDRRSSSSSSSSSGSGRYDDDRRYSSGSRGNIGGNGGRDHGQGGWFGDSEGHSRASQRGWDNRGYDRDDDDRGNGRNRR